MASQGSLWKAARRRSRGFISGLLAAGIALPVSSTRAGLSLFRFSTSRSSEDGLFI
jgi:hypothetical protein